MNIWDIYKYNLVRMNKHQSGRSFTPDDFNTVAPMVNFLYFKIKVGLPETYQPGMPFPPQAWQVSQKITDDLKQFLVWMGGPDKQIMKLDKYGVADIPSDYFAFSSCYYDYVIQSETDCTDTVSKLRPIEFVTDAVYADRMQSVVKPPEKLYPIAKWLPNKIQFAPKDLNMVHFTYLREPATPVLGWSLDGNNDIVYDPATSVQFEWPAPCLTDISNLIFEVMAENMKSQLDIQMAVQRKVQGQ